MLEANDRMIATLLAGAETTAETVLKRISSVVPFGITLGPESNVSDIVFPGGAAVPEVVNAGVDALLSYEAILNAEMRKRAGDPGVAALALVTSRDTSDGKVVAVQIEFAGSSMVIVLPYRKRVLGGWSFGTPASLEEKVFPPPYTGTVAASYCSGPFENAFAPSRSGDALIHRHSGFRFPARLGDYAGVRPFQYDPHGHDVSYGYNHSRLESLAVTVYLYPCSGGPAATLAAHFDECKANVVGTHKVSKLLFEDELRLDGAPARVGRRAVFRLKTEVQDTAMDSVSELCLFKHGSHFVKYRASYPPALNTTAPPAVRQLLNDLAWPTPVRG